MHEPRRAWNADVRGLAAGERPLNDRADRQALNLNTDAGHLSITVSALSGNPSASLTSLSDEQSGSPVTMA
jgi:hypothetical protein